MELFFFFCIYLAGSGNRAVLHSIQNQEHFPTSPSKQVENKLFLDELFCCYLSLGQEVSCKESDTMSRQQEHKEEMKEQVSAVQRSTQISYLLSRLVSVACDRRWLRIYPRKSTLNRENIPQLKRQESPKVIFFKEVAAMLRRMESKSHANQ